METKGKEIPLGGKFEMKCCNEKCGVIDVKLDYCARCRTAVYCSKPCQRSDWTHHKPICIQYPAPVKREKLAPAAPVTGAGV